MTEHFSLVHQGHHAPRRLADSSLFFATDMADLIEYRYASGSLVLADEVTRLLAIPWPIVPHKTIEGAAAHLTRHLQSIQRAGPYLLGGLGLRGGIIACEMAAQLVGQDQHVEFIGLVDDDCATATLSLRLSHGHTTKPSTPDGRLSAGLFEQPNLSELMQTFGRKVDSRVVFIFTRGEERPPPHTVAPGWQDIFKNRGARFVSVPALNGDASLDAALLTSATKAVSDPMRWREFDYIPDVLVQQGAPGHGSVFCIPGAGDNGAVFTPFAEAIGPEWSVHALQARGLDGNLNPHTTVEAVAALNVRRIATLCPIDAPHLVGHSFGGWIALEIARQMQAKGRKVASITMVDSEPPTGPSPPSEHTTLEIFAKLVSLFELSVNRSLKISSNNFKGCGHQERLRLLHQAIVRAGLMSPRSSPISLAGPVKAFSAALRTNYSPIAPYPHTARLILLSNPHLDARANERKHLEMVAAWQRWAPHIATDYSSGNHFTALKKPHVNELAAHWKLANTTDTR